MRGFTFLLIVFSLVSAQFNIAYTVCRSFMGSGSTTECLVQKARSATSCDKCQKMCEWGIEEVPAILGKTEPSLLGENTAGDFSSSAGFFSIPQSILSSKLISTSILPRLEFFTPRSGVEVYLLNAVFLI